MKPPERFPPNDPRGEVIATVDIAIERTETLIAKQQQVKIRLIQHLFTRRLPARSN